MSAWRDGGGGGGGGSAALLYCLHGIRHILGHKAQDPEGIHDEVYLTPAVCVALRNARLFYPTINKRHQVMLDLNPSLR